MQDNGYYKKLVPEFGKLAKAEGVEKAIEIWENTPDLYTLCASLSEELGLGPFDENEIKQVERAYKKEARKEEPIELKNEWDRESPYGRVQEKYEDYMHSSTNSDLINSGLYEQRAISKVASDFETHPLESHNETSSSENSELANSYKKVLTNPSIPSSVGTEYVRNNNYPDAKTVLPGEINYEDDNRAL